MIYNLKNFELFWLNILLRSFFPFFLFISIYFSSIHIFAKETENIINNESLKFFPKGAVIINSARGDMIEDDAMIKSLKDKKIYALGLDVYKGEPQINAGYLNLPNVFLLPHLGSATKKTRTDMADLAIDNIKEYFDTGNCKNKVN